MSKIALSPNISGTGTLTISAPNTNSDRTLTLPDTTAPLLAGSGITLSASAPANTLVTTDAGNVGIGTSSPSGAAGRALAINGGASQTRIALKSTATGDGAGAGFQILLDGVDAAIEQRENAPLRFATNSIERMRIDPSGRLLVGVTTALAGNFVNIVNSGSDSTLLVAKTSATAAHLPLAIYNNASSGDNKFIEFFVNTTPTPTGSIDFNRGASVTRYNTSSDGALKNIVGDADGAKSREILSNTRVREYAWKDDPDQKPQIGVIAQELYETFKGAVSVGGEQEDGKYRPWAVDKTAFTFHLVAGWQAHEKMIQELNAKVDAQAAEIAALKGQA